MQKYLLSMRKFKGVRAPVLIKSGEIGGDWLAPVEVYIARDVDEKIAKLEAEVDRLFQSNRQLQARDDYVTACLI